MSSNRLIAIYIDKERGSFHLAYLKETIIGSKQACIRPSTRGSRGKLDALLYDELFEIPTTAFDIEKGNE
ncbi:hypothetical protein [uncultured Shewanella sp.]|uniref:hypothetical protein n=1 Tax=uncultured Shewanella sp. TaxID=173975 RepID=UPI00261B91BE|nr:hypothetical protein [uncultured Shewanella sp.]